MKWFGKTLAFAAGLGGACVFSGGVQAQTLQDALIAAYRGNPQMQGDRARQRATDEDVSRAWGGYRPQVVVQGEQGRAKDRNRTPGYDFYNEPVMTAIDKSRTPAIGALQITQNIWDGNHTLADVAHSKWAVENGLSNLLSTEQGVLGDVVQAYYDLYRDQKILEIQKQYVASLEEEKAAAAARYQVKDVTQTDVAQADARLARGIADRQQYEGNIETSRSNFLRTAGFTPGVLPPPPPLPTVLPKTLEEAMALADENPDIKAAIYAEKAAESDVDSAESGLLPNLSVQATSTYQNDTDYTKSTYISGQVLLNLTIPLYDGGVASARTRAAKHTVGQRRLDIDVERDRIVAQVKQGWENLQATRARITSLRENARAADVALKGVQQELRVGSRTVLDELNARQEVLDTEVALLRSQHDEAVAAYSILVGCGLLTAKGLELPVELYDAKAHYEDVRGLPWGPWIGTDYPPGPKVPDPK